MSGTIKIRLYINTGFAGCTHKDTIEFPRDDWEAMSEEERQKALEKEAGDFLNNHIDYGAYVIEEGNDDG